MTNMVFGPEVAEDLSRAQETVRQPVTRTITVDATRRHVRRPFPSPVDWRDCWVYFLVIDRFNNPNAPPAARWNDKYDFRQGGTFEGVRRQLGYLEALGVHAIWLSPVLKNSRPREWRYTYPGYATQDFLNVDERFASDGTRATAERELTALVDEAHARGMYVILDVVLNHAAHVFDYLREGHVEAEFADPALMDAPLGREPHIEWLNGLGLPRGDWEDALPAPTALSPDDAVWPVELQRREFFRRRGSKLSDYAPPGGFARGDFGALRQLVVEYDARVPGQEPIRDAYGTSPVLNILIRAHEYLIAKYDVDGFRVDTVKYVSPAAIETFGNAIREFALSIGKSNFFTFGEVYDNESTIANFVGRNTPGDEGFGIDAALDFPLFYVLPSIAKGMGDVDAIRRVFLQRKSKEEGLLSSHGEAGRYFVSFLDNHDQHERFRHPQTPEAQIKLGLALLFTLQGIPCLYYGTEQGLTGTVTDAGEPSLDANESVREALWGRGATAFDQGHALYSDIQSLARLRRDEPALRYGRLYFREVSGNGRDFGLSSGPAGVVAYSRILTEREIVVVANTDPARRFTGFVLVDLDLHRRDRDMRVAHSNKGTTGSGTVQIIRQARFHGGGQLRATSDAAALYVELGPSEVQVLVPES
jgi:glycosidase